MTLVEVVVALFITGLTVTGIINGYMFCSRSSAKDALSMVANTRAMERMETVRSAQWDTSSFPPVDKLVATNFPDTVLILDRLKNGTNILATVRTDISQISTVPPLRRIRVDCIWQFNGAERMTNTIETCRAPD